MKLLRRIVLHTRAEASYKPNTHLLRKMLSPKAWRQIVTNLPRVQTKPVSAKVETANFRVLQALCFSVSALLNFLLDLWTGDSLSRRQTNYERGTIIHKSSVTERTVLFGA